MFIDTHFHLENDDLSSREIIKKANEAGVSPLIMSGCNRHDIEEALSLVSIYPNLYTTIGFHPDVAGNVSDSDLLFLEESLKQEKVIGIGEIGLDYHYGIENKEEQKKLLRYQLKLAEKYHLPVVIHTRDAIQDTYDIIKEYKVVGIIHCFSESYEMAKLFLKLGFYFGIGGVLTFKNSKLGEVVKKIPLSNLVLETDSPYLAPDPYRGSTNGPWNIPIIAQKLASVKEVSIDVIRDTTTANVYRLFDLN